jgi:hypothetical protein
MITQSRHFEARKYLQPHKTHDSCGSRTLGACVDAPVPVQVPPLPLHVVHLHAGPPPSDITAISSTQIDNLHKGNFLVKAQAEAHALDTGE